MRIQIESTRIITEIDGAKCRVWNGVTESGVQVFVFVTRLCTRDEDEASRFVMEVELQSIPTPSVIAMDRTEEPIRAEPLGRLPGFQVSPENDR